LPSVRDARAGIPLARETITCDLTTGTSEVTIAAPDEHQTCAAIARVLGESE
jgi:hypothetical protein